MAIAVAKQTIWHKAYEHALKNITSLRNHCDFKYEADSKNADTVNILFAAKPTIKTYVPGTAITREAVDASRLQLTINQFKYFNIGMDDVYKAQTVPGAMEAMAQEGATALAEEGDKYVADLIKTAATASGTTVTVVAGGAISKSNVIEKVEDALAGLYSNNVKVSETLWFEVCPGFYKYLRPAMTELLTDNVEMAKKGIVGRYGNANVTIENLLPSATASGTTTTYNVIRTNHAVAFVEQIRKTEAYRVQDGFEDAIKALYCFGGLVVRPEEMAVITQTNA
ncbi:MAG: hypothetical protein II393_04120 [Cytophagales bacterium]|nr:hypothetical protein [Cytophagales bacterium]